MRCYTLGDTCVSWHIRPLEQTIMAKSDQRYWGRLSIHELEADIAYFDARIALVKGAPDGPHREAQMRTYSTLERILREDLDRLRGTRLKRRMQRKRR